MIVPSKASAAAAALGSAGGEGERWRIRRMRWPLAGGAARPAGARRRVCGWQVWRLQRTACMRARVGASTES